MPQLDLTDFNLAAQNRRGSPIEPLIIDGDAVDVTPVDEDDTDVEIPQEPPFPKDLARDREPSPIEQMVQALPYGPIRAIRPEELVSKANLLEQLTGTIPTNEYNLPDFVYRADLLDHVWIATILNNIKNPPTPTASEFQATTTSISSAAQARSAGTTDIQAHLDASIVRLIYHEGFPTMPNGIPFWMQLDFEPKVAYDAFLEYLELGANRALHKLQLSPLDEVREHYHMFYWSYRVRAFDLYRLANATKVRLQRALEVDDNHYTTAGRLLKSVTDVLGQFNAEEIKEVGFEKLVGVLDKLAKIQRVAVGMSATGGSADEGGPKAPTTSVIIQQIAQNTPQTRVEQHEDLDILHDNPEALDLAQELIIRSQKARPIND